MADASRLKQLRRSGLGPPPPIEEARADLATSPDVVTDVARLVTAEPPSPLHAAPRPSRIDGRTLRRSGRTVQFATRVSPEFDERLRQIAQRDGVLLVEVLERALEAYEASRKIVAR